MADNKKTDEMIICYLRTVGYGWAQEVYETASKDAVRRARQLRKAGYRVVVSPMGLQVTKVGLVKLTMVDIRGGDTSNTPLDGVKVGRI